MIHNCVLRVFVIDDSRAPPVCHMLQLQSWQKQKERTPNDFHVLQQI